MSDATFGGAGARQQHQDALIRQMQDSTPVLIGATDAPAFTNSWVNFDAAGPTQRAARYWRKGDVVILEGVIKSGASGSTAFTLPEGFRPPVEREFAVISGGTPPAALVVFANGAVAPTNTGASAVTTYCFLDGVNFRVA